MWYVSDVKVSVFEFAEIFINNKHSSLEKESPLKKSKRNFFQCFSGNFRTEISNFIKGTSNFFNKLIS